jgi:hypothetical protein
MKKLVLLISSVLIFSSCSTTKDVTSSRALSRDEKKLVKQETVKNAVESRRFIVKLNRMYLTYGGIVQLVPRANYIIVDGEKGIVSAAYFGRQFSFRRIAGINMVGRTTEYELTKHPNKGTYGIKLKVSEGGNSFDIFLSVNQSGSCDASISSLKISNIRYSGNIVPINSRIKVAQGKKEMI